VQIGSANKNKSMPDLEIQCILAHKQIRPRSNIDDIISLS